MEPIKEIFYLLGQRGWTEAEWHYIKTDGIWIPKTVLAIAIGLFIFSKVHNHNAKKNRKEQP